MTQQCLIKFDAVIRNAWISYSYGGKCCNQRRCLSVASSVASFFFFKYSSSLVVIFVFLSLPFLIELPCWALQSVAAFPSLPPLYLPHPTSLKMTAVVVLESISGSVSLFTSFCFYYCSGGCWNQWRCLPFYPPPPPSLITIPQPNTSYYWRL